MKKKIVTFLLPLVLLGSCIIESHEEPRQTAVAYNVFIEVNAQLKTLASYAETARIAEMWRSASSDQERYAIEDKYFGQAKIRLEEDTIHIVGLCKIKTYHTSLSGNTWELFPYLYLYPQRNQPKYEVSQTAANKLKLTQSNESALVVNLSVEIVTADKEYLVSGNSTYTPLFYLPYYNSASYVISTPIRFVATTANYSPSWFRYANPFSGKLDMKVYQESTYIEQDDISVTYHPGKEEILFRGVKEVYYYYNY